MNELTREQILSMPAGRELNALVAEHVMGINLERVNGHDWLLREDSEDVDIFGYSEGNHNGPVCKRCDYSYCHHCITEIDEECVITPETYSTKISRAWEVLEKPEIMDVYQIGVYPTSFGKWIARPFMPGGKDCTVQDETAPIAICKCVLLAVMNL